MHSVVAANTQLDRTIWNLRAIQKSTKPTPDKLKDELMTIWNNCKMTTLYHSADASHDWPCIVKIDDKKILVEYEYEGEALVQ